MKMVMFFHVDLGSKSPSLSVTYEGPTRVFSNFYNSSQLGAISVFEVVLLDKKLG